MSKGPLEGVRIIELAGIGPAPYAGQLLQQMGADVILVERPGGQDYPAHNHGKRSIVIDLRQPGGADLVLKLAARADVLIEGLRPGVTERLGVGPQACHAVNPKLVYGRMTGWGQTGPWAQTAGHDINYLSITGALNAIGEEGRPPPPPLNMLGDYGGGSVFLVAGVLAALLRAQRTGEGDIVDAAIVDGAASLMGMAHALDAVGGWNVRRQSNFIDGAAPYYRCYATQDGGYMAVGCIEPKFFAEMLSLLQIDAATFGDQNDQATWPHQHEQLEALFASRTREDWAALFDGTDACVSPVLDMHEAVHHKQNAARANLLSAGQGVTASKVPRFASDPTPAATTSPEHNGDAEEILRILELNEVEIAALRSSGAIPES